MPVRTCLGCGRDLRRGERCAYCEARRDRRTPGRKGQKAFRARTLALTGGRCARCGSPRNVQAHHTTPVRAGGQDDHVGVALCPSCHGIEDARLRRA